ncbi:hypothetical protein Tco_0128296 [Tanacetum coccineum]
MFLNMDQLEKQLDKDEFQEIRSMAAFRVLETQCQKFINSWISLDDEDGIMTRKYFLSYTQTEVKQFRDTLIQHMKSVKKSIDERAQHKREYDNRVNERQMQTTEGKVDTSNALDASLVDTESSGTESGEQDTSSRSGNDAHADDADIRLIYDEEPMAEKCVFNANHDACVTKFLNEVNSRAKVTSHKTTNRNKSVKQISIAKKPDRHIPKGHRFSIKKTSTMHEKTKTPRSCLRWQSTGRILKTVGLRWVPTGKIFTSSTTTVDSEPPHGSNIDITNPHKCRQTLDLSAGTSINVQKEQTLNLSARTPIDREKIKALMVGNRIAGRPFSHGITLEKAIEIYARPKFQGIRSLPTS